MLVNESNTIQYTVTTTNTADGTVLYWRTTGNTTNSDIVGGNTGSVVITNNQAVWNVTVASDATSDGIKALGIAISTVSVDGPSVVETASPIIVNDTSLTPSYSVSANTATVDENNTVVFTVTTTNVPDGTTLYWTNSGNTAAVDFSDSANSGTVTINGNTGTITRTLVKDYTTEGLESIVFELRTTSVSGSIVYTANLVDVIDTSQTPTYSVTANTATLNEGGTVTFTVTTTNVDNGTTLYWTNSGSTVASDFTDSANSGTVSISGGTGTITRTLVNDVTTEGIENIVLDIRTGSSSGTIVATNTVTVLDTSGAPTYSVTSNTATVSEGNTVVFTISTTYVDDGTTLYWTNSGNTAANDFADSANSGSFTITSGTGTVSRTLTNDVTTEGTENIVFQVRTVSTSGTVVATNTVVVLDTSQTVAANPTYNIRSRVASVNESFSNVVFDITTTDVPNGTILYWSTWSTSNVLMSTDFIGFASNGTVVINNNSNIVSRIVRADSTTEGTEYFYIQLKTDSQAGPIVAISNTVTILDTSLDPVTFSAGYLIVAGGGSGAGDTTNDGAGGGAGGMLTGGQMLSTPGNYFVDVGAGGSVDGSTKGWNSQLTNYSGVWLTAQGGGAGIFNNGPWGGENGGSGGGGYDNNAKGTGTAGQGNDGGFGTSSGRGGGGGGAGAAGSNATPTQAGNGGIGRTSSITGSSVYYAGGGGGSGAANFGGSPVIATHGAGGQGGGGNGATPTTYQTAGVVNTGGGGGGGAYAAGDFNSFGRYGGGAGGSGIVVVTYAGSARGTGGTITTVGGNTVHTFTSSGMLQLTS
jgi:hypothetical protein